MASVITASRGFATYYKTVMLYVKKLLTEKKTAFLLMCFYYLMLTACRLISPQ